MDVSAEAVARVPTGNLQVPRAEFGAVWAAVARWGEQPGAGDDFLLGVLLTCQWLADQPVWSPVGRGQMPSAPFTGRRHAAMPETIDAEYVAAAVACHSTVARPAVRTDLARGVVATLDWTWHGSRRAPVCITPTFAG